MNKKRRQIVLLLLTFFLAATALAISSDEIAIKFKQLRLSAQETLHSTFERAKHTIDFIKNWEKVGAVTPSSEALAKEMVNGIVERALQMQNSYPCYVFRVLDVGAESGVFTAYLAKAFHDAGITNYRIYALEFLSDFAQRMQEQFADNPNIIIPCQPDENNPELNPCGNILTVKLLNDIDPNVRPNQKVDAIMSGLPFYSDCFTSNQVNDILQLYTKLLRPGGLLRWFSYSKSAGFFLRFRKTMQACKEFMLRLAHREFGNDEVIAFEEKSNIIERFKAKYAAQSIQVAQNFPPAWAHQVSV